MATLNISNITQTTVDWNISGLGNPFNTTYYIQVAIGGGGTIVDGQASAPSIYQSITAPSSGSSTTTPTATDTGYSAGGTYTDYGYAQAANGLWFNASSVTFTMVNPAPNPISSLTVSSITQNSALVSWINGSYTTDCTVYIPGINTWTTAPGATSQTVTGLSPSTNYTVTVTPYGNGAGPSTSTSFTTASPPLPSQPTGLSASGTTSSFSVSWLNGANTNYCTVWLQGVATYTASVGASSFSQGGLTLTQGQTYFVTVTPFNGQGAGTDNTTSFTVPITPPANLTGLVGTGVVDHIHVSWNASSGATSYTVSWTGYTSGSTSGITGLSADVFLTTNHSYTVTVTPVNAGGSGGSMTTPTIALTDRPSNFAWTTPKVSGQTFALTYIEWSSFTNTINGFRTHVGLATFSFTAPVSNNPFIATMFNQAVTAINAMSPPTAIPIFTGTAKFKDDTIYAQFLNDVVTSLNSIP